MMKLLRSIIIFVTCIFTSYYAGSQQELDPSCISQQNTTTTDWEDTINSLNDFDWTVRQTENIYLSIGVPPYAPTSVLMPMWRPENLTNNLNIYEFISNENQDENLARSEKDFQREKGWELLFKDFGTENQAVSYPSYALYNRHLGLVRVFTLIPYNSQLSDWTNGASYQLFFGSSNQRITSLFATVDAIMEPVETFNTANHIVVLNQAADTDFRWYHADFTVSYDPCTCMFDQESKLTLDFSANSTANVNLNINGSITEIVSENGSGGGSTGSAGKNFFTQLDEVTKAGVAKQKDWESTISTYSSGIINISTVLDSIILQRRRNLGPELSDLLDPYLEEAESTSDLLTILGGNNDYPTEQIQKLTGQHEAISSIVKGTKKFAEFIPWVGFAFGVVDAFTNKTSSEGDSQTQAPMLSQVDLVASGTIERSQILTPIIVETPGTQNEDPVNDSYLDYDNVLGVVHLLKAPGFKRADYNPSVNQIDLDYELTEDEENEINLDCFEGWTSGIDVISQFKVNSTPQIALNPAARLKPVSAEAAFVFDYSNNSHSYPVATNGNLMIEGELIYNDASLAIPQLAASGIDLEYMKNGSANFFSNNDKLRFRTQYQSLECLADDSFFLLKKDGVGVWPDMYLKVIYTFEPIDNSNDLVTIVHTYNLDGSLDEAQFVGTNSYGLDFICNNLLDENPEAYITGFPNGTLLPDPDYYQDLYFSNTTISEDVFGKIITIASNVEIEDGVTITASEAINILDDNLYNTLGDDITFKISGLEGSCDVTLGTFANGDQIAAVCSSDSYKERATFRNQFVEPEEDEEKDFTFKLFPNPVENYLTVNLSIGFEERVLNYRIMDVQGREVVNEAISVTGNRFYHDVSSFTSGVYIFEVQYPNGRTLNKKFIKQ